MSTKKTDPQDVSNTAASAASGVPKPVIDAATTPPPPPPPAPGDEVDDILDEVENASGTGGVWGRPKRK